MMGGIGYMPMPGYMPMAGYGGFTTRGFSPIPRNWFSLPPVQPFSPVNAVNGFNPLMFSPFNPSYSPSSYYATSLAAYNGLYSRSAYGSGPSYSSSPYVSGYGAYSGSGYVAGGYRNYGVASAEYNFGRAQELASGSGGYYGAGSGARKVIDDQRAYERRDTAGQPGANPDSDATVALARALAATDPAQVASGDVLNQLLTAAENAATQAKSGKVDSANLPPNLLAEVRFSGGPNGDALNLLRSAGKLEFSPAFNDPALAAVRPALEKSFSAAAAPVLAGKPADRGKVAVLEVTVKKAQDLLTPAVKDLAFEDSTAARRLLNQLDATVAVLKGNAAAGLVDPKWATEGTSVADLVRHMAKYKLTFGPVRKGHEEVYLALHRGLAGYLFTLDQSNSKPKKP
jgi:hypothetical protein